LFVGLVRFCHLSLTQNFMPSQASAGSIARRITSK